MYLIFVAFSMSLAYLVLFFIFPIFFKLTPAQITTKSFYSIASIMALSFMIVIISLSMSNLEFGNRFLHAFGGGFLAFLTCFLVIKDGEFKIDRFQFFLFSFLISATLGIGNEIIEFFLQNNTNLVFSETINDTWLDLISNTVGTVIAAICFVPLINHEKIKK